MPSPSPVNHITIRQVADTLDADGVTPESYASAPFLRPDTPRPAPFPRATAVIASRTEAQLARRRRPERHPRRSISRSTATARHDGTPRHLGAVEPIGAPDPLDVLDPLPPTVGTFDPRDTRPAPPSVHHEPARRRRTAIVAATVIGLAAVAGPLAAATRGDDLRVEATSALHLATAIDPTLGIAADAKTDPGPGSSPTTDATISADPTSTTEPTTATTNLPTTPPTTSRPVTTLTTVAPTTTRPVVAATVAPTQSPYSFLACVRHRESRGNYQALNRTGAAGAYQLLPGTARATAQRAGRPDLAATPVINWSPGDQDAMAASLYQWQGKAPWGGGCY